MVQLVVFFSSGSQNNYMEVPGSAKIKNNATHPKHQEEEETPLGTEIPLLQVNHSRHSSSLFPDRGN